jgi:hypothetical protein
VWDTTITGSMGSTLYSVPVMEGWVQSDSDVDGMTLHLISWYTFNNRSYYSHNNVQIFYKTKLSKCNQLLTEDYYCRSDSTGIQPSLQLKL